MEESSKEEKKQEPRKKGELSEEEEEFSTTQRRSRHSKKHKHKHSKKHKSKQKKRKHKRRSSSRSISRSSSRSRSKSPGKKDNTDDESYLDPPGLESYDVASFKLEKSISKSPSPKINEAAKKIDEKWPLNSSSPCSNDKEEQTKDESESPPFYTEQDLLERDGWIPITKSPIGVENAQDNSDSKLTLGSDSELKLAPVSNDTKAVEKVENIQSNSETGKDNETRKSKSKSPAGHIKRSQSRSSSRSDSPKSKKRRGASHSKSRSKSPKSRHTRRSLSRSSSRDKRKSSKKSRSRSSLESRSRSPKRKRNRSTDRKRSSSRDCKRSRSRDRRSKSKDRRRSRERKQSRSRDRKSRSRSLQKGNRKSYGNSPRRGHRDSSYDCRSSKRKSSYRRSPSPRKRSSRRSRSRSPQRRYRGRSGSLTRRGYKNRSRSKSRSRRSRSRSYSSRIRRSRTHSRSKSRDRSKKKSKSKSPETNSDNKSNANTVETVPSSTNTAVAKESIGKAPTITDPSNKKSLAMLTEFCKKLTEARGIPDNDEKEGNDEKEEKEDQEEEESISHPFLVAPKKDITIPQVIFPVKPILPPINMIDTSKPLMEQFPVSCGTKHHEKEAEDTSLATIPDVNGSAPVEQQQTVFHHPQVQEKLDISSLVVKRMDAQRRLQANANDVDAMLALQEIEMKLNNWCQSNVKPGQFTGQLAKQMMPKEKMNAGFQAWAKKDMFQNLNPVSSGIGMKLLQKMGWAPGQVLGRSGKGMVEPIALPVKVDRKGLSSTMEKPVGKKGGPVVQNVNAKTPLDLQGKHPISLLQEYCARRKWNIPEFTLIFDEGPPHSKQFLFKVLVNGWEYQHPVVSGNKKHAKAQAAVAALKGLGLVPEDAQF